MRIIKIHRSIYVAVCKTQRELAHTFMRFQEHHESPNEEFRKRAFTRKEYAEWARKEQGEFSYYSSYVGFSLPGRAINRFKKSRFEHISTNENLILEVCCDPNLLSGYLIGIVEHDPNNALYHELAHALYDFDPPYAQAVRCSLEPEQWLVDCIVYLSKQNYDNSTIYDEINAYIINDMNILQKEKIQVPSQICAKLRELFLFELRKFEIMTCGLVKRLTLKP